MHVYTSPALYPFSSNLFSFSSSITDCFCSSPCPSCWTPRCQHVIRALQSPAPFPSFRNSTNPTSFDVFTALLFGKFRPSWPLHDLSNSLLLSAFYFVIYITSLFFSVCSFYFLCLLCLCRTPLGSVTQYVSVGAAYCCPMSVYIKPWNTVTPSDKHSKNFFLLYSMFLGSEALLADNFLAVSLSSI